MGAARSVRSGHQGRGIVGASMVVPGLSVSMLLLALGIYEELLGAVAQLDLAILLPAALGFVPGLVLVSKAMNWLFERKYGQIYYAILGLMLGSLAAQLFPAFPAGVWSGCFAFCSLPAGCGSDPSSAAATKMRGVAGAQARRVFQHGRLSSTGLV